MARIVAAQVLPKVDWVTSWANLVISAGLLLMLAGIGLIVLGRKGPDGLQKE